MVVETDSDILKQLMKLQNKCPNCSTELTFEDAARLGKDNGVSENAIMCHNCKKVYNVELTPTTMDIKEELTKYNFSKEIKPQTTAKPQTKTTKEIQPIKQPSSQINEPNEFIRILFYKKDAKFGLYRLSKTKVLSELWFVLIFSIGIIYSETNIFESIITSIIIAIIFTLPVFIIGWIIGRYMDNNAKRDAQIEYLNEQVKTSNENETPNSLTCPNCNGKLMTESKFCPHCGEIILKQESNSVKKENETNTFKESDNLGTNHDTVEKATAYWLGERLMSDDKPPFSLYIFNSQKDGEDALLELPFIHKASDTGKLICDKVLIYGCYKVDENNYEAIVCGKDLTYEEFEQTENAFKKHGGSKKNNLEPEKNTKSKQTKKKSDKKSSVKFREKFNRNQYTYECYDADTKEDAMEFLKSKPVNERLYYVCVYTPEGDYGRDIDGIYQM